MAREQFGVCAEPNLHGSYLLFNVLDDKKITYAKHYQDFLLYSTNMLIDFLKPISLVFLLLVQDIGMNSILMLALKS